ncbi:hypothetical protein HMPREF0239_04619, partial [Clostridium sp. ATCC BAA-442]
QSTHPARGATSNDKRLEADELLFQSTHPARGATGNLCLRCPVCDEVSIHAPREGCDYEEERKAILAVAVSIHAPREGCDYEIGFDDFTYAFYVSIHAPREGCDGPFQRW